MAYRKITTPPPTKEHLEALYNTPMSLREVAKATNCSLRYIHQRMQQLDIKRRSHSAGLRLSLNQPHIRQKLIQAKTKNGFAGSHINRIASAIRNCIRPLVALKKANRLCEHCSQFPAAHMHHQEALSETISTMLSQGQPDLEIIVTLCAAHYAGQITLIALCEQCHKICHSKKHS